MPIKNADKAVKKALEDLTTESWLNADTINTMFSTKVQKKKLADLHTFLNSSTAKNMSTAALWGRLATFKDVVVKLVGKSVGI